MNMCTNCAEEWVLRLVDGDVKPSMGFIYGELLKAKREIKEAFGNNESWFKEVIAVIDKKMKGRLDSPLHLIAYLLNPHYSYSNPSIFDEPTITEGFISCVETFYYHDEDKQDQAANIELKRFQNREGPFNKKLAKTCGKFDYNPGRGNSYYMVVSLLQGCCYYMVVTKLVKFAICIYCN